jgi:hypothetical protein
LLNHAISWNEAGWNPDVGGSRWTTDHHDHPNLLPAIRFKDRAKVEEVASLLRDRFGMRWHALVVKLLGVLSRYVPPVNYLPKLFRIRVDSRQAQCKRVLESKWEEYSQILEV